MPSNLGLGPRPGTTTSFAAWLAKAEAQDLAPAFSEDESALLRGWARRDTLADALAARLLDRFPAEAVCVRIRKGNLPLSGGQVEVELERTRS